MATVLPLVYRPLLIADSRRALAWERNLRRRGIGVILEETTGADADAGAWQVAVLEGQEAEAKRFVAEVLQGRETLRGFGPGWKEGIVVLALLAFLFAIISEFR